VGGGCGMLDVRGWTGRWVGSLDKVERLGSTYLGPEGQAVGKGRGSSVS